MARSDPAAASDSLAVYLGVVCGDGFVPADTGQLDRVSAEAAALFPRFADLIPVSVGGGRAPHGRPGASRPAPADRPAAPTASWRAPSTSVHRTNGDSRWPRERGRHSSRPGATHGVYGSNTCVNNKVSTYLIDLTRPDATPC